MSQEVLRIVDANLNRIAEGLRVLEDIARLALDDAELSRQLKELRHRMRRVGEKMDARLIQSRNAAGDVGADITVPGQESPRGLRETVVANSRRVQESLRVLEEVARTPGLALDTAEFRQARFEIYTLEKGLLARLPPQET